jgi:hypothetical protein
VSESQLSPETVADPAQPDWVMRNAGSCFSCHNSGLISFQDTLRPNWEPAVADSASSEQQAVLDAYPPNEVLDQVLRDDDAAYWQALQAAGVPLATPDAVSRVFVEFQHLGIDEAQAAAELFVTPAQLRAHRDELPLPLRVLGADGASVSRDVFVSVYLEALCALHQTDQVLPARCR